MLIYIFHSLTQIFQNFIKYLYMIVYERITIDQALYSEGNTPNCSWKHFVKYDRLLNPT